MNESRNLNRKRQGHKLEAQLQISARGPGINSTRGRGGRHLGGGPKFYTFIWREDENIGHFKRSTMEFLLKS